MPNDFIEASVLHSSRSKEDRDRDASSHPAAVLKFMGVAPGMAVLDLNSATGYYTELLSRVVGESGRVIAHNHPGAKTLLRPEDMERRYHDRRLPNIDQLFARHNELNFTAQSLDAVLMSMIYHDLYWHQSNVDWGPIDIYALLNQLHAALKPGGVVCVIDHHAGPGIDPHQSAIATHRIDRAMVLKDFLAVGFVLDAESDVLRNPADDHQLSVFDPKISGKTDQFILRFRR